MFPWATVLSLAGQAVSSALSVKNNKDIQQNADAEAARQQAFYNAQASQDPLARSDNRALLGLYDRAAKKQVDTARNVATIKGATPEYSAAVQKAVAEGRADLMGKMSIGASARADRYNTMGELARHQKAAEDQARRVERNQTFANLAANAANAAGTLIGGFGGSMKAPEVPESQKAPVAPIQTKPQPVQTAPAPTINSEAIKRDANLEKLYPGVANAPRYVAPNSIAGVPDPVNAEDVLRKIRIR